MKLVDSHCHLDRLNLKPFDNDLSKALAAAEDADVRHFLCVGINLQDYSAMCQLIESYSQVSWSVGVHPNEAVPAGVETLMQLGQNQRVVALGETGLDYYRLSKNEDKKAQQTSFVEHIHAAKTLNKPLIIHTREAKKDTLSLLHSEKADEVGGVLHCFTEDWAMAKQGLDLGFYVSFSGIVTFKNAESLREVARQVPADRLLIETDAPYLAPAPHRGQSNHPAWVRHVAELLAEIRNESLEQLAENTTNNFSKLFGIVVH